MWTADYTTVQFVFYMLFEGVVGATLLPIFHYYLAYVKILNGNSFKSDMVKSYFYLIELMN